MDAPIVIVGSPTALGGHFAGMERSPVALRERGLLERLASTPRLGGVSWRDAGDVPNDSGWAPDADPRAKNRALIGAYLPRLADHVARALSPDDEARLLALGGDCTTHAGVMAGLRRVRPERRLGIVWFDAHGDFNTPDTTPSGNVWGMPFAMLCGRGDDDLVAACDGPTVDEADAALLGGQALDEPESRTIAASRVAHFGAGMLGTEAGRAALRAWADVVAGRIDGWYLAIDLDAIDVAEGLAVATPEPDGLSLADTIAAVRIVAGTGPVVGLGATATQFGSVGDPDRTVTAIAALADAGLGRDA
jgi:arginase